MADQGRYFICLDRARSRCRGSCRSPSQHVASLSCRTYTSSVERCHGVRVTQPSANGPKGHASGKELRGVRMT